MNIRPDRSGTILVRKAKSDQFGERRLAYLSAEAVEHLQHWLRAGGLTRGLISRTIDDKTVGIVAFNDHCVANILKRGAKRAGLTPVIVAILSSHSMRAGAAQDMVAVGIDLGAIMHAGGWKPPGRVKLYIEHMDVGKSGMAMLYQATTK